MKAAVCFSGQGAQHPKMFYEIYSNYNEAKRIFSSASKIFEFDVAAMCFEGTKEQLQLTTNTQPCVLTCDMAAWVVLKKHFTDPFYFSGFSLGEFAALYAAESLSLEDVCEIVKIRAKLMHESMINTKGAMLAVFSDNVDIINKALSDMNINNVWVSNINTNRQIVISGYEDEVFKVKEWLKNNLIANKLLPVSAAFHCKLMESAKRKLKIEFHKYSFKDTKVPILCNYDAIPTSCGVDIKQKLLMQTTNTVLWKNILNRMNNDGINLFIECGPGKTLSNFVKKMNFNKHAVNVSDQKTLINTISHIDSMLAVNYKVI